MTAKRRTHIHLRCENCGNAVRVERAAYDPDQAAEMCTSACSICDRGDFEMLSYSASDGSEVWQQ